MKKIHIIFLLFVFTFGVQAAYSQCCCGKIRFAMVDAAGKPLMNNRLKIRELGERTPSAESRISYERGAATENTTSLAMRCSSGGIVEIIYKGATMRVNFKFGMDESANGEIIFQKGDFIAEPDRKEGDSGRTGMVIRKAESGEMKE